VKAARLCRPPDPAAHNWRQGGRSEFGRPPLRI